MTSRQHPNREKENAITSLIRASFQMSLRPSPDDMNSRVNLLLLKRDISRTQLAKSLGISGSTLTRWLNDNRSAERFSNEAHITTMSELFSAPALWIRTGSLDDGAPFVDESYLRWIDAVTAVAAVQLYGALQSGRCPSVFFALLNERSLRNLSPVKTPFPGPITTPYRDAWNRVMRKIPFLPADAQAGVMEYWDLIAGAESNPNRLIDPDTNQTVHLACSWAVDWAQKIHRNTDLSAHDSQLARDIRARKLQLRQWGDSRNHFRALDIDAPEDHDITAATLAIHDPATAR